MFSLLLRVNLKCSESVDGGTCSSVKDAEDHQNAEFQILIKEEEPEHDDILCKRAGRVGLFRYNDATVMVFSLFNDIGIYLDSKLFYNQMK